jgi:hypothetical protein
MKREWFPAEVSATASRLSWLWVFYMFNTAYVDITTLYYSVFINHHPEVHYTQVFLLCGAVLVEIPTVMVISSRMLAFRRNRMANVIVGALLTVVQVATLFVGTPTLSYAFISAILIATSGGITWYAWNWTEQVAGPVVATDRLETTAV